MHHLVDAGEVLRKAVRLVFVAAPAVDADTDDTVDSRLVAVRVQTFDGHPLVPEIVHFGRPFLLLPSIPSGERHSSFLSGLSLSFCKGGLSFL